MKKYFIAGGAAIAVFSISAFAASLQVNAGTLQTGVDMNLECVDAANVLAWGFNDTNSAPAGSNNAGTISYVVVELVGAEDCDNGEDLHVAVVDKNGRQIARGQMENDLNAPAEITGDGEYTFLLPDADAEKIAGIRISVDQGHENFNYPSSS